MARALGPSTRLKRAGRGCPAGPTPSFAALDGVNRNAAERVAGGGVDLWASWKTAIYGGSVLIGLALPLFFFFVRP